MRRFPDLRPQSEIDRTERIAALLRLLDVFSLFCVGGALGIVGTHWLLRLLD